MASRGSRRSGRRWARAGWDQVSVYLPVILMGLLALGTYWLARNSPTDGPAQDQAAPTHQPDSTMRGFSIKTFDPAGRLRSELNGSEARHYPDTDTLEVDQPRVRSFNERGQVTVATGNHAISNGDGSEVQLMGNAVVVREAAKDAPRLELRSEFLQVFSNTERVKTNKPVEIFRGNDHMTGDSLDFDNIEQVLQLKGRVKSVFQPRGAP